MKPTNPMPLVYVAGPYRAPSVAGVELNIQAARAVGLLACRKGWAPIIPHANTAHLDICAPDIGDEFWLDATMAMMRRCDAVVLVAGWERSSGTRAEMREADRLFLPIYRAEHLLPLATDFLRDRSDWDGIGGKARSVVTAGSDV